MDKTMEFKNWFIISESEDNQVDIIIKDIAKKFGINGLNDVEIQNHNLNDLKRDEIQKGDIKMNVSLFNTLNELGMIRQMSDDKKSKLKDVIKNLKTVGDLAIEISKIINGEQQLPNQ